MPVVMAAFRVAGVQASESALMSWFSAGLTAAAFLVVLVEVVMACSLWLGRDPCGRATQSLAVLEHRCGSSDQKVFESPDLAIRT